MTKESLLERIVTFPYKKIMFPKATKEEVSSFQYSKYLLPILDAVPGLRLHRSTKLLERLVLFSSNCPINFRESLVDYAIEPLKDARLLTYTTSKHIVDALKDASDGNQEKKKVFQEFIYDGNLYEIRVSPSLHGSGFGPELVILPNPWPEGDRKILMDYFGKIAKRNRIITVNDIQ